MADVYSNHPNPKHNHTGNRQMTFTNTDCLKQEVYYQVYWQVNARVNEQVYEQGREQLFWPMFEQIIPIKSIIPWERGK
jgi:hypothetical protein